MHDRSRGRTGGTSFGRAAVAAVLLAAALSPAAGCGRRGAGGPSREELTSLLRQEAQAMKATGETLDPVLGVKASWTVSELTVSERPGDADRPWAGVIRFRIRAETKDSDGSVQVDEMDKRYEYLWSASLGRWLIQPSS